MFAGDDHPVAPRNWFTVRHAFDHAESFIAQEVVVHLLLPVEWDVGWCVTGLGGCHGIDVYLDWWPLHAW